MNIKISEQLKYSTVPLIDPRLARENWKQNQVLNYVAKLCHYQVISSFSCFIYRAFNRQSDLDFHMKGHSGQRDFICDLCGEQFLRKSNLERHMTVHSNPNRFECHICRKNFKRRDQLEGHLSWAHSDGPKFKCDYCDVVLPSMKRMWNHRVRKEIKFYI